MQPEPSTCVKRWVVHGWCSGLCDWQPIWLHPYRQSSSMACFSSDFCGSSVVTLPTHSHPCTSLSGHLGALFPVSLLMQEGTKPFWWLWLHTFQIILGLPSAYHCHNWVTPEPQGRKQEGQFHDRKNRERFVGSQNQQMPARSTNNSQGTKLFS